jgi:hypothetical protein
VVLVTRLDRNLILICVAWAIVWALIAIAPGWLL